MLLQLIQKFLPEVVVDADVCGQNGSTGVIYIRADLKSPL